MSEKEELYSGLDIQFRRWRRINAWIDRVLLSVLLFLTAFTGTGLIGGLMFLEEGNGGIRYDGFDRLLEINPDTVAWLTLDGTHIDHPVVRSTDNFDYLDKGFRGEFYAGGTLFMDKGNPDPEDTYCIIHGHHMAGGAMFGDLSRYLEPDFFDRNRDGVLLTPAYDYDIQVFAAGIFDAYDSIIYSPGDTVPMDHINEKSVNRRKTALPSHVLALSTCLDDMTDRRAVVFCELTDRRPHV